MKSSFKPRVEMLEGRLVLDGYSGTHALYQDIVIPAASSTTGDTATAPPSIMDRSQFAGNDSIWIDLSLPIRRTQG